jgi:hypothetical protein
VLAVLSACPAADAAPVRRVTMEWSKGDPACVGEAELIAMVERTLGRAVFHADAPPFAKVSGAVGRVGRDRFEARIALFDTEGRLLAKRTLVTPGECGRLDEAIAVVVTLMIDGVEETPAPLEIPAAPPRPATPRAQSVGVTFGAGGGVSKELLPGYVAAFSVRGEIAVAGFVPIALALRVHAPSTGLVPGLGVGGKFTAVTGEIAACPAWSGDRVRLGACVGMGSGGIEGAYVNLAEGEVHVRPLAFASLLPFASVRVTGWFRIRTEAGVWVPLLRERWGYLDPQGVFEEIFRPAPVVPWAGLTLEVQPGS